jgi:hypothetical protein
MGVSMAKRRSKKGAVQTEVETANGGTAVAESPVQIATIEPPARGDVATPPDSFAEKHRPERVFHDPNLPQAIAHNNVAGVTLLKHHQFKQSQLKFRDEVPSDIQEQLRQEGWTHRPAEGVYTKQFGDQGEGASLTRAKHLYHQLVKQLTPVTAQAREF